MSRAEDTTMTEDELDALEARYAPKPFDGLAYVARDTTVADAKREILRLVARERSRLTLRRQP